MYFYVHVLFIVKLLQTQWSIVTRVCGKNIVICKNLWSNHLYIHTTNCFQTTAIYLVHSNSDDRQYSKYMSKCIHIIYNDKHQTRNREFETCVRF